MPITSYLFTTTSNYIKDGTEVSSGKGRLDLIDLSGQTFNEDFADDTGFTHDNTKSEFIGGLVRAKDRTPANSTFHVEFSSSVNANWADGATAITANVGPVSVSGGRLDLKNKVGLHFVDWAGLANADHPQVGTIRFNYIPDYSGTPADVQVLFVIGKNGNEKNMIRLDHRSISGDVQFYIYDNTNTKIVDAIIISSWSPISGTVHEFEIDYDITAGATRIFLDGVQQGSTITSTLTRDTDITIIRVGSNQLQSPFEPDFELDNFIIFDAVQHTGNYTPGIVIPATRYGESVIELPTFAYAGVGDIQSYQSLVTTEGGSPRYHIDIGGTDMYWNGASWVASDGTYLQSNSQSDFSTNLPTLAVGGDNTPIMKTVFPDSNTQSSVDDLTLTYTGQQYNSTGTLIVISSFMSGDITDFQAVLNEPGADLTKFAFRVDGADRYWNGSVWATSDLSEAQTNTLAEVQANVGTLLTQNSDVDVVTFLKSAAPEVTTPDIDSITITHDFGAALPTALTKCSIFGYLVDAVGVAIKDATIEFQISIPKSGYSEASSHIIHKTTISTTTDDLGYFTQDLIRSVNFEGLSTYILKITLTDSTKIQFNDGDELEFIVPNQASADITGLITQAA